MVEIFFKALKSELVWRTVFQTRAKPKGPISLYLDGFYNQVRRNSAHDLISPVQFERLVGEIAKRSPHSEATQQNG